MLLSFLQTGAGCLHSQQATNFIFSSHLLERPHIFIHFLSQIILKIRIDIYIIYCLYFSIYSILSPNPWLDFFSVRPPKVHILQGYVPFPSHKQKKRWIFRSNLSRPADWKKLIFPFNSSAFTVTMPQCHSMTSSPVHLCRLFMVQSSKSNALKPVKESK